MLFPFLKEQLGVRLYRTRFWRSPCSALSPADAGADRYLADHIGARKVLLIGLTVGGLALIMLGCI